MASPTPRLEALVAAQETAAVFPRVRWMGSKHALLPVLAETFEGLGGTTALDAFSGSGVVSYLLKKQGYAVHSNDYLRFPGILNRATVVNQTTTLTEDDIAAVLGPNVDGRDFIRSTYEGIFFAPEDLDFLDSAWSNIDRMVGHKRALATAALCLSAARKQPRGVFTISGDLSRYDDGRRDLHLPMHQHFVQHARAYSGAVFRGARCTTSAHEVSRIPARPWDVVYLDPPYAPPRDDNDYIKRHHFLEGLSRYWEGDSLMWETKTRKLPKRITPFSTKRTILGAFEDLFHQFRASTIVLSYGSNALPDLPTLVAMLHDFKSDVEIRLVPHRYSYGTHAAAQRRAVDEYVIVAS